MNRVYSSFLTAVLVLIFSVSFAGAEPPAFIKKLHNLQGIRYPSDFKEEISKSPKSITGDFLLISKKGLFLNKGQILWVDAELPSGVQPSFANEICKKYGGTFYSLMSRHPVTGEQSTYDQVSSMNQDTVGDYICRDADKVTLFTMEMKRKSSQHFRSTGDKRTYGDVLVTVHASDTFDAKDTETYKESAEEYGAMSFSDFVSRKGFLSTNEIRNVDSDTIQRLQNITLSSPNHLTTEDLWSKFLLKEVPMYCRIKGGELYKASSSELFPFAKTIYETVHPMPGMNPNIAGDYMCKGGSEEFMMKISGVVRVYKLPKAEIYFTKKISSSLLSLPLYGSQKQTMSNNTNEDQNLQREESTVAGSEPAVALSAESSVSEAQRSYKNEPDGFRNLKWGQDIASIGDMTASKGVGKQSECYTRKGDSLKIGEARLKSVVYCFWNNKLWFVQGDLDNYVGEFKKLEEAFVIQFGSPSKTETIPWGVYKQTVHKWVGNIAETEIRGGIMTPASFQIKSNAVTKEKISSKGNLGF